jgi:ribonuclease HI
MKTVTLFTDGSALKNPGPGGYGAVLVYGKHRKQLSGGFRRTTNNRMEIAAVIEGLRALKSPCTVTVWSDSQYLVNAVSKHWIDGWQKRGWKKANKESVKNVDLWRRLLEAMGPHDVKFRWLRGHNGHPENERCDQLARNAAGRKGLPEDEGFAEGGDDGKRASLL